MPGAIVRPKRAAAFMRCESRGFASCMAKLDGERGNAVFFAGAGDVGEFALILIVP